MRSHLAEVLCWVRKHVVHDYILLFALLWYLGDLIKDQEPAVQGAAQIQIKSPLWPPVVMSFLNSLDSQQRAILNCCLALDRKSCQQWGQTWHWRTGCQGRAGRQAPTDTAPVLTPSATMWNSRERKNGTAMLHPSHQMKVARKTNYLLGLCILKQLLWTPFNWKSFLWSDRALTHKQHNPCSMF